MGLGYKILFYNDFNLLNDVMEKSCKVFSWTSGKLTLPVINQNYLSQGPNDPCFI